MDHYTTSQTVRLLSMPLELSDIINSYLFYDKITGETRNEMKKIMQKIIKRFDYAYMTRIKCYDIDEGSFELLDKLDEHWCIWMIDIRIEGEGDGEPQMQGLNCRHCGGYKVSGCLDEIPAHASCHCL